MRDWNVVVTTRDGAYEAIHDVLSGFGPTAHTDYYNVLVLQVADISTFLADFKGWFEQHPEVAEGLSRVMPVRESFNFQTAAEFEEKAKAITSGWLSSLADKRFHVRMHRRGFKGRLSSQDEERFLDFFILGELEKQGKAVRISFNDPDYILVVETVGQRAGLALWSRAELARYPFLKLD